MRGTRRREGEFLPVTDNDESEVFVYGHVSADTLAAAVEDETGLKPYTFSELEHAWFRCVPNQEGGVNLVRAKGPARGAFRVTYARVE